MTIQSSFLLALRLVFPKTDKSSVARKSLSGALLCIGISIVPLVVVLTVSNGMIHGMTERIIGLSSSHLEAVLSKTSHHVTDVQTFTQFAKSLSETDGIVTAFPEMDAAALAASTSFRVGVQVRAVLPEMFAHNNSFKSLFEIVEGSYSDFVAGTRTALVGQKTAELLGIHTGDSFRLIAAVMSNDGAILPRVLTFSVAAVISSGYQELDAAWLFIPLDTGFTIIKSGASKYSVLMETVDAFSIELIQTQELCIDAVEGEADIYRWDELNRTQYENFSSTKVMLVFIMLLIVLVASVNISSSLIMLVMEKRREIAILKSMGASSHGIAFSFFVTGTAIGIGGVLVGLPIGLVCAVNINQIIQFLETAINGAAKFLYLLQGNAIADFAHINLLDSAYYLSEIPVLISFQDLAVVVIATILLSLAVSVIPAYKAGREKPLETLRKI